MLCTSATTNMYAYVDCYGTVIMGVYFCYMTFNYAFKVSIPILHGCVEDLNDVFFTGFFIIKAPARNNSFQVMP
jgi:hypothetical protein